jgi:hypothetical protein
MLALAVLLAQPFPRSGSSSTTAPVSPSVLATVMTIERERGKGALELLVLWRGSPAWFWRADGRGRGGSSSSAGQMGSPELVSFLQCDVKAPNASASEQQALDMWCAWAREP